MDTETGASKPRQSLAGAANKTSSLPRPTSRLPLPRATGAPSSTAGRSGSRSGTIEGSLPLPKDGPGRRVSSFHTATDPSASSSNRLRTSQSRDQLNSTVNLRNSSRNARPPVSSQAALVGAKNHSLSRDLPLTYGNTDNGQTPKGLSLRKKTSEQSILSTSRTPKRPPLRTASSQDMLPPPLPAPTPEFDSFDKLSSQMKNSRQSLAERTMETLAQLPSSPAFKRRGSNFFEPEGSVRPSSRSGGSSGSRPGSSYRSESTVGLLSRPGSSSAPLDSTSHNSSRTSTNSFKQPLATVLGTPSSRRASGAVPVLSPRTNTSTAQFKPRASLSGPLGPRRTPSPDKKATITVLKNGSHMPRGSVNGLFKKQSMPSLTKLELNTEKPTSKPRNVSVSRASIKSSTTSGGERDLSSASPTSTALTAESSEEPLSRKSSAALREQIAKAKAAKRAASSARASAATVAVGEETPVVPTDSTFDFGLENDPFNQKSFEESNRKVMLARIKSGRTTGKLNIAAMGLKNIPDEVRNMYDLETIGDNGGTWAESVDLSRFVAADNELELIDDVIFPDTDPADMADDEEGKGHQFGGLESLDLHGNMLMSLPMGLRRLHLLTSLNLTQNKLANNCLDSISQIKSLRDLRLGKNLIYGTMEASFFNLENLEILDLQGNNITALPDDFQNLTRLRILNLNENALESLSFTALSKMPLTELLVHKNKLTGTLMDGDVNSMAQLQILDVSANQLTLLRPIDAAQPLQMPALHQLTVSMNRIQALPNMSSWKSLLSLTADENSIAALPDGFTNLTNLRHVDFTSNDIRVIPPEVAHMESLAMLRITGNPLREKKFASLTTDELKALLSARLEPRELDTETEGEKTNTDVDPASVKLPRSRHRGGDQDEHEENRSESDNFTTPPTSVPHSPAARSRAQTLSSQTWPIKNGGVLDRVNTQSSSLHPVVCSKIAAETTVREIWLQRNLFTTFPNSLSFFADTLTSLCMSYNQLVGESYLTEELDLTALQELNLSQNHITGLNALTTHLRAPNLQKLDVSCNRVVSLPPLRESFPSLAVLLISSNHLEDLKPEAIKGLKVVDASNNDIAHLDPRLGLLAGQGGGLERLEVIGNRFRVPRWNVLERGTDAVLRWLRGRVPVAEMIEWRLKAGEIDDDGSYGDVD